MELNNTNISISKYIGLRKKDIITSNTSQSYIFKNGTFSSFSSFKKIISKRDIIIHTVDKKRNPIRITFSIINGIYINDKWKNILSSKDIKKLLPETIVKIKGEGDYIRLEKLKNLKEYTGQYNL